MKLLSTDERGAALHMLRLATMYIAKANEQGAYNGCTLSGDTVLRRLEAGIEALSHSPQPCPICLGAGAVDSGGQLPWGEWANDTCTHCNGKGWVLLQPDTKPLG
jgi:hypothetical protein